MLGIIESPQRLTHILYRSNMSYGQLIKYLDEMKEMGMIEEHKKPFRCFKITNKGKLFREMLLSKKEVLYESSNLSSYKISKYVRDRK